MKISIEQKSIPTVRFKTLVSGDLFICYEDSKSIHIKTDRGYSVTLCGGDTFDCFAPDDLVINVTDQFELTRTAEYLE
jgi:hypothetical protein